MKTSELFESKYPKASDLTKPIVAKISEVQMENFLDGSQKAIVFFEDLEKGLVLNKINCRTIEEVAGCGETDEWEGVSIRLFATTTDFKGKRVPCIRVAAPSKPAKPQATKKIAIDEETDDVSY
jgi:hypothetical protein